MRILNYTIATGFGLGYLPLAPGTAASIFAIVIIYLLSLFSSWWLLAGLFIMFFLGVYTGNQIEKERGKDPSIVVIDEIVGMGLSLMFIPEDWRFILIAFILFRVFDTIKPPPIDRSERLPGGYGIMMDDLIAGIYTFILTHLTIHLFF